MHGTSFKLVNSWERPEHTQAHTQAHTGRERANQSTKP